MSAPTPIPPTPKKKKKSGGGGFVFPHIFVPVPVKWIIKCSDSGSNICCYATTESGSIVSHVQCSSYRKQDSEYIDAAIKESNFKDVPAQYNFNGITYDYDTIVENNSGVKFYRYKINPIFNRYASSWIYPK